MRDSLHNMQHLVDAAIEGIVVAKNDRIVSVNQRIALDDFRTGCCGFRLRRHSASLCLARAQEISCLRDRRPALRPADQNPLRLGEALAARDLELELRLDALRRGGNAEARTEPRGFSSLSCLRSFPFDKIKIDQSFIAGLADGNEESLAIVLRQASRWPPSPSSRQSTACRKAHTARPLGLSGRS